MKTTHSEAEEHRSSENLRREMPLHLHYRCIEAAASALKAFACSNSPRGLDQAHHRLPASMHMDVLDRDLLLTLATMAVSLWSALRKEMMRVVYEDIRKVSLNPELGQMRAAAFVALQMSRRTNGRSARPWLQRNAGQIAAVIE